MPIYAFFDVDETIVSLKTMISFQKFWCDQTGDGRQWAAFCREMEGLQGRGAPRERMNKEYYKYFCDRDANQVRELAVEWWRSLEEAQEELYRQDVVEKLRNHQADNQDPVFVSGSFHEALAPIANRLGIRHVLATRLKTDGGKFTGTIEGRQVIGLGKALAIGDFLAANAGRAAECHAYGDDISDRFMLAAVGHPTVVSGNEELELYALHHGWPILR